MATTTLIANPSFSIAASFSSGGPRTGDSVLRPGVTAPGVATVSTAVGTGNGAATNSGTSMATPHVAGVAALVMQSKPGWSIDDLRLNFQFGCEAAWEIENGRIGRLLKNPLYTGATPAFWRSCDAIGDAASWHLWGLPNCGKGDPMQTMRVAHGAPA